MAVAAVAIYYYFKLDIPLKEYPEMVQGFIFQFGVWGPVLYILIYAIRPIVFFPATILTIASGLLFGPWLGILYTIIGENMSANLAFFMGRYFGRSFVAEKEKGFIKKVDAKIRENGFMTVLLMRLLYFPFDLTNYGCGLTSVKHKDYFWATVIGIMPGLTTFVLLGSSFTDWRNLIFTGVVFVLGLGISAVLKKRYKDFAELGAKR